MAVRAGGNEDAEELGVEVPHVWVVSGKNPACPLPRKPPQEHQNQRFRIRGRQDKAASGSQDPVRLTEELLRLVHVLVHFGRKDTVHGSLAEREGLLGVGVDEGRTVSRNARLPEEDGVGFDADGQAYALGLGEGPSRSSVPRSPSTTTRCGISSIGANVMAIRLCS